MNISNEPTELDTHNNTPPPNSSICTSKFRSTKWQHSFYTGGRSRANEAQVSDNERQVMDIRTIRKVAAVHHSLN